MDMSDVSAASIIFYLFSLGVFKYFHHKDAGWF